MAEVGIIASIFSIATFGTQVAVGLYKYSDDLRNAPRQIRRFAKKVTCLADALQQVRNTALREPESYNKEAEKAIRTVLRSCKKDLRLIDDVLQIRKMKRIAWLFKKPKAEELMRSLETQTSTLQILIQSMTWSSMATSYEKYIRSDLARHATADCVQFETPVNVTT
jgi:chromosome segregation ATPase